jgi:hypothetical protein
MCVKVVLKYFKLTVRKEACLMQVRLVSMHDSSMYEVYRPCDINFQQ